MGTELCPLPRCAELAERLERSASGFIDPPIALLRIVGVPVDDAGNGVVVAHVPRLMPRHIAQMISGAMFGVAKLGASQHERDSESYASAKPGEVTKLRKRVSNRIALTCRLREANQCHEAT